MEPTLSDFEELDYFCKKFEFVGARWDSSNSELTCYKARVTFLEPFGIGEYKLNSETRNEWEDLVEKFEDDGVSTFSVGWSLD